MAFLIVSFSYLSFRAVAHVLPPHASQLKALSSKPNIVWIVGDDVGFSDLGFQNGAILTPNIDRLASTGSVLTNLYVQSQCSPTRASFMTGRYPIHTGVKDSLPLHDPVGMSLEEVTIAQLLRDRGYSTHAVGKWHLGSLSHYHTPTFRGFQSFYGYYGGGEHYGSHTKGSGIDFHRDSTERCGWHCSHVPVEDIGSYSTELFTNETVRLIAGHSFASAPLFIYLAYQAAHFPGEAPESYLARYGGAAASAASTASKDRLLFAAIMSGMDDGIGKVLTALDGRGVADSTLVLFTTDNGGGLRNGGSNDPLRGGKGEVWEGGTRSVAVVRGPGLEGGRRLGCLAHAVDWLPTLLSMAGSPPRSDETLPLDGIDLWPALVSGDDPGPRAEIFYGRGDERNEEGGKPASGVPDDTELFRVGDGHKTLISSTGLAGAPRSAGPESMQRLWRDSRRLRNAARKTETHATALRIGNLKLVLRGGDFDGQRVLFDLKMDPGEQNDLSAQQPEQVKRLSKRLKEIQGDAASSDRGVYQNCPHPVRLAPVTLPSGEESVAWEPFCDAALNITAMSERVMDAPLFAHAKEIHAGLQHTVSKLVFGGPNA